MLPATKVRPAKSLLINAHNDREFHTDYVQLFETGPQSGPTIRGKWLRWHWRIRLEARSSAPRRVSRQTAWLGRSCAPQRITKSKPLVINAAPRILTPMADCRHSLQARKERASAAKADIQTTMNLGFFLQCGRQALSPDLFAILVQATYFNLSFAG